jgi:hypothetical protein
MQNSENYWVSSDNGKQIEEAEIDSPVTEICSRVECQPDVSELSSLHNLLTLFY